MSDDRASPINEQNLAVDEACAIRGEEEDRVYNRPQEAEPLGRDQTNELSPLVTVLVHVTRARVTIRN